MSLFVAPALTTPLLKVPLLLVHAVCTYEGMTPPQPPPSAEEQAKMKGKKEAIPQTMPIMIAVKVRNPT